MAATQYEPDLVQKILNETDLSDADRDRQRDIEKMDEERLVAQKLNKQFPRRESSIDSLEREASTVFEQILNIKDAIDEREDSDEFQHDYNGNAVDSDDYDRVRTALDKALEQLVPKLGMQNEISYITMMDIKDLVDTQQFANDMSTVREEIREQTKVRQDNIDTITDIFQKAVNSQTGSVERALTSLEQTMGSIRDRDEYFLRMLEVLESDEATDAERDQLKEDLKEKIEELQAAEEELEALRGERSGEELRSLEELADEYDLNDQKRRIIALKREDASIEPADIAKDDYITVSADSVNNYLSELRKLDERLWPESGAD
ncbi:hypothetical protein G3I44_14405 [Halogeometricum borinquense]|uniref:Uncharacterized protein n=1 Tax=Halogeometricum borinquense TaxID=60847 RepID=A0A6C0UR08_9EURY|nr:hypothetical protein [Halogeometricum borinquense]QIB75378.1 hypothetical protein G3I44_14405 [Halogeometricum borinquense]